MKRPFAIICISIGIVILCAAALSLLVGGAKLSLTRKAFQISGEPSRYAYMAELRNWSLIPLRVEGLKLPGGFAGAGTLYPCQIEVQTTEDETWRTVLKGTLDETGGSTGNVKSLVLPLQKVDVCHVVLPFDGMSNVDCVRVSLRSGWSRLGPVVARTVFASGNKECSQK